MYRGGKVTYLPLFEGKKRSTDLADDIKNYLRRDGKTIEDAKREFLDGVPEPSTAIYATIGEILDFHAANVARLEVKDHTAREYRYSLLLVVRHALAFQKGERLVYERGKKLDFTEFRELSTAILTERLAKDFKEAFVGGRKDGEATLAAQRSANSYLGNAQAVFSKDALRLYRGDGIRLPTCTDSPRSWRSGRPRGNTSPRATLRFLSCCREPGNSTGIRESVHSRTFLRPATRGNP